VFAFAEAANAALEQTRVRASAKSIRFINFPPFGFIVTKIKTYSGELSTTAADK
jgi:hypothetical protein